MPTELLTSFVPWSVAFLLATLFYLAWLRERKSDRHFRELQFERDEGRAREEGDRKKEEAEAAREEARYSPRRKHLAYLPFYKVLRDHDIAASLHALEHGTEFSPDTLLIHTSAEPCHRCLA